MNTLSEAYAELKAEGVCKKCLTLLYSWPLVWKYGVKIK